MIGADKGHDAMAHEELRIRLLERLRTRPESDTGSSGCGAIAGLVAALPFAALGVVLMCAARVARWSL